MSTHVPTTTTTSSPSLTRYREAVDDLVADLAFAGGDHPDVDKVVEVLDRWAGEPELAAVLRRLPSGGAIAWSALTDSVRRYAPSERSSARHLPALVRIFLLSQIDALWWARSPMFATDADVRSSRQLVDLERLREAGNLRFRYKLQPHGLPGRVRDHVVHRFLPAVEPITAGLSFPRARPEVVAMLNGVARDLARLAPAGTPPLWLTSTVRSVEHQRRLRSLGYAAVLPSAHCAGFAADVEMRWFHRFGAAGTLADVLLARQADGLLNVIDEGQAWHVCVSPEAVGALADGSSRSAG